MALLSNRGKNPPSSLPGFEHINRYWDKTNEQFAAKILPGEFYVTLRNEIVTTVLGSCVSACIRDRRLNIGGMNHFMLPDGSNQIDRKDNGVNSESARYGNYAMEHLINAILKEGGSRKYLEVKLTGGGKIIRNMGDVGKKNIAFVTDYLETEGLEVISEDLGDIFPRKVIYNPKTGQLRVKKLRSMHNNTVIEREKQYQSSIDTKPVNGDIELF